MSDLLERLARIEARLSDLEYERLIAKPENNAPMPPGLAARYLGIGRASLYRRISPGRPEYDPDLAACSGKMGARRLFDPAALRKYKTGKMMRGVA